MASRRIPLALLTFLLLTATGADARQRAVRHTEAWPFTGAPADVFSYAEPARVTTRHLDLDLTVDFEAEQIRGQATLTIENRPGNRMLVLDTYELAIERIVLDHQTPTLWSLGYETPSGRALRIAIQPNTRFVTIDYATEPEGDAMPYAFSPALNFTRDGYLYSLTAPVGSRSWMPVQDTPTVRMTYEATLRVPPGKLALMSAAGNPQAIDETGVYDFHMPYPIPAYLIAMAVGDYRFRSIDGMTGVYAAPGQIDSAASALQSLPAMMDAAEQIAGPFPFARHDVLITPSNFVADGMEHPMLNFIHPGKAGDPTLIAHELAHSWAGDATTLATWNDVWLNEGFATYLAHRILEELLGPAHAENAWSNEYDAYRTYTTRVQPFATILDRDLHDPTLAYNRTSYAKGALFLRALEEHVGRPTFDVFLRSYFARLRWRWVDDRMFLQLFRTIARPDETRMPIEEWLYEPGLPVNDAALTTKHVSRESRPSP